MDGNVRRSPIDQVTVIATSESVRHAAPFHPDLRDRADELDGRADPNDDRRWIFPSERESAVRKLCRELYGAIPLTETGGRSAIRITAKRTVTVAQPPLTIAGRVVLDLMVVGNQTRVRLGDRVFREGKIVPSVDEYTLVLDAGCTLAMRSLHPLAAEAASMGVGVPSGFEIEARASGAGLGLFNR